MMNRKVNSGKRMVLTVLLGMMLLLTACSSKETVLLEEEDLVRMEENAKGITYGETVGALEDADSAESAETTEFSVDSNSSEQSTQGQVEQSTLFVHICGEVMKPGVYELPAQSRIYEAVEAAGGFTKEASESYVNLAQVLEDGCKIEIPAVGEEAVDATGASVGITGPVGTENTQQERLIDINTATKAELCSLPGIGESRADSIITYREKNGGFSKIEDIMKVEGIKEGMFAKMKDKICVRGVK